MKRTRPSGGFFYLEDLYPGRVSIIGRLGLFSMTVKVVSIVPRDWGVILFNKVGTFFVT